MQNKLFNQIIFVFVLIQLVVNIMLIAFLFKMGHQTIDVLIDDTFSIHIKTSVPINTTVNVPVTIPIIGQKVIVTVPIDTEVPINTTIQVPIKTSVPVNFEMNNPFSLIFTH